jgi:predicted phage-related endonuclease
MSSTHFTIVNLEQGSEVWREWRHKGIGTSDASTIMGENPPANGMKFFAASELLELVKDRAWLVRVTNAVNHHWHQQNARKKCQALNGAQNRDSL